MGVLVRDGADWHWKPTVMAARGDAEYAPAPDPREGLFVFDDFHGLRNNVSSETFLPGDLVTALNCDIDDALNIKRRKGHSAPVTSAIDRDLWSEGGLCLGVGSDALKLMNPDYSTVTLRSGLTASRPLAYALVGDRAFYSNGVELGCVQNGVSRTWGITPPGVPIAAATGGTLMPGLYQYAVTYLRDDGQESGTGRAGTIELLAAGGIALSLVPVSSDPSVTAKAVYISTVGGETLWRAGIIANATTTFTLLAPQANASPLLTQFLSPPPPGDFLGYFNGTLLVAAGNRLYQSEPYAPELFDYRKSIPFMGRVTMIAPIVGKGDGFWLGTDKQVIWINVNRPTLRAAGESTSAWDYQPKADYGVIPGTLYYGDGELLGDASVRDRLPFFATTRGLCVGKPGGDLINLTQARFAYPAQERGAGLVRRHRGIAQYVVVLRGTEVAGNVAA